MKSRLSKVNVRLLLAFFVLVSSVFSVSGNEVAEAKRNVSNQSVTQAEYIMALLDTIYADSHNGSDLSTYLDRANSLTILTNEDLSEFEPNEKVTREQAYIYLIRALNVNESYDLSYVKEYRDYRSVNKSALDYFSAAAALGFIEDGPVIRANAPLKKSELSFLMNHYETHFEEIAIMHTNDLHGRILYNQENGEMGFAKIGKVVNEMKSAYDHTLVLDMGDTFHGTNYVNFNKGDAAVEVMNEIGYTAMVPGNHDFNYGHDHLLNLAQKTTFPIISANVLKGGEEFLPPTTIIEEMGKKIALIGLTATDTLEKTHPNGVRGLSFEDEVETARNYARQLENEVDHIIILSHSGYATDKKIAEQVDGIDLVLGGHSHTTIETPEKYGDTYVTQAYEHGKAVGRTNMLFYKGELVGVNGYLVRDQKELQESQTIVTLLNRYKVKVEEALQEVIGFVEGFLDGSREKVRVEETNLGNLISDAQKLYLDTDVALTNGGNIRESIGAGEVTAGDILTVLPFTNTLVKLEVTGRQIVEALEHSVRLYPSQNGGFMHVSGLTFSFHSSKPSGERVRDVTVGGQPIDLNKIYTVATNDFIAAGGDGYEMFINTMTVDTGILLSDVVANYIKDEHPIPELEGRIKRIDY